MTGTCYLHTYQTQTMKLDLTIIIIQEIVHEVHIPVIYIYSKTRHMNIKKYKKTVK